MEHADSSCPLCCREIAPREGGSEQQVAGAGELRAGIAESEIEVVIGEVQIIEIGQAYGFEKEDDIIQKARQEIVRGSWYPMAIPGTRCPSKHNLLSRLFSDIGYRVSPSGTRNRAFPIKFHSCPTMHPPRPILS